MNGKKSIKDIVHNGLFGQNPTFRMALGLCPTLAVTALLSNVLIMGIAVIFVLVFSNMLISMARRWIPGKVRIPAYIVIIATFVTIADLVLGAYVPDIHKKLGVFIPLIVVNCIIFARAESFASRNPVIHSMIDGLAMGIGFTLSLSLISIIREILGTGRLTLFDTTVFTISGMNPAFIFMFAPGAFLTMGLLLGLFNYISLRRKGGECSEPACHTA